jgi:hypothetical protein
VASSSSGLTILSICHVGISECKKLEGKNLEYFSVAKFHENRSSRSVFIKCVLTSVTGELFKFVWARLYQVRDAHRIVGNGVIVPPHDFGHISHWCFREYEIKKYEFVIFSRGTTSVEKFMKIRPAIL